MKFFKLYKGPGYPVNPNYQPPEVKPKDENYKFIDNSTLLSLKYKFNSKIDNFYQQFQATMNN